MELEARFEYLKTLEQMDDKKIILEDLMNVYGKAVWNYAFSITRKPELADDITQDVFLKVYLNLHSYRRHASIKTWLLTITRNAALDVLRSAYVRKVVLVDRFFHSSQQQSAESEVMETMAIHALWSKVLNLPVKYREVLVLFAHHQLSMKEIANVLGVSEGTVKSRLFHARSKLSKIKER